MKAPLVAAALVAAACGDSTEGANGLIDFSARDCGLAACTFDDGIAADSTLTVDIAAADSDVSLDGVDLEVDGAGVTQDGATCFTVEFGDEGSVALRVVDADGEELDHLDVLVETADELSLELDDGDAGGPDEGGAHDETWTLGAGDAASFYLRPLTFTGGALMGRFDYTQISTSSELEAEINADVADGHFEVSLEETGEHWTVIRNSHLADVDVLFVVE
ncbi:MAG TPA: hypothetical protein VMZ28_15530 [Kofleriaceae bacterium]|nr:hypothetical protein [Kofleriaceae bacterium]